MKKTIRLVAASLLALFGLSLCACAQSITSIKAQSRYPWSDLVDLDYTIEGVPDEDAGAYEIALFAVDGAGGRVALSSQALDKAPPVTSGSHRVTWNPLKQLVPVREPPLAFSVELHSRPFLYCVIDLRGGADAASYPVSYLDKIPGGTWGDDYRTNKLVLRRIPAG